MNSTIRMNVCLVKAFQFLQQFCLMVRHKPRKEHIIPDALSRQACANRTRYNKIYFELDALFTYNATLVKISPELIKCIFDSYLTDDWWVKVQKQLLTNNNLGPDKAILLFVFSSAKPPSSANLYFLPRPELQEHASNLPALEPAQPMHTKGAQLIYYLDHVTGVCQLCIPPAVVLDLLAITHDEGHFGFACCHEIISRSWYIRRLTKILRSFIRHYPQYLALETKRHSPYSFLQPIHLPPVSSHLHSISYSLFSLPLTNTMPSCPWPVSSWKRLPWSKAKILGQPKNRPMLSSLGLISLTEAS